MGKKKLSLLVLNLKVQVFTPFTFFFWVCLPSWRIKYLKSLCLALTSSLCSEPFLLLKILLPTTCFQDVFELFFRFPHKFPGRTLNFLFASIYIIKLKVQREGNCTVKKKWQTIKRQHSKLMLNLKLSGRPFVKLNPAILRKNNR